MATKNVFIAVLMIIYDGEQKVSQQISNFEKARTLINEMLTTFLNYEARIFTKRETRKLGFLTMTLSSTKVETTAVQQNNAPALRSTYEILINNGATHCSYPK